MGVVVSSSVVKVLKAKGKGSGSVVQSSRVFGRRFVLWEIGD